MSEDIGPALPPDFKLPVSDSETEEKNNTQQQSSPSTEVRNVIGPVLPPGVKLGQSESEDSSSSSSESEDEGPKPSSSGVIGPALPPGMTLPTADSSESEDESIGPRPYAGPAVDATTYAKAAFEKRAQKMKDKLENKEEDVVLKRESWMIELPEKKSLSMSLGLTARTFSNKREEDDAGDGSEWTETPADRERKAQEGTTVKKRKHAEAIITERDIQMAQEIQDYNKKMRPSSLLEMHQQKSKKEKKKKEKKEKKERKKKEKKSKDKKKKKEKQKEKSKDAEKKPERVPFDRDNDLALNRIDDAQRRALIKKAAALGGRFKHGGATSSFL